MWGILATWIRIRIPNADPGPDTSRQKWMRIRADPDPQHGRYRTYVNCWDDNQDGIVLTFFIRQVFDKLFFKKKGWAQNLIQLIGQ